MEFLLIIRDCCAVPAASHTRSAQYNNNNHFIPGTIRYISDTSNTSYGFFRLFFIIIKSINALTLNARPIPFSHHLLAYV